MIYIKLNHSIYEVGVLDYSQSIPKTDLGGLYDTLKEARQAIKDILNNRKRYKLYN